MHLQVGQSLNLQFDPAKVLLFDANTGERLGAMNRPLLKAGLITWRNSRVVEVCTGSLLPGASLSGAALNKANKKTTRI
jgi:hypothetical protein